MTSFEKNYGLSSSDLDSARLKLARQKRYLLSNNFTNLKGETKTFLDLSFSANLSERYYPRLLNKIDTFVRTSESMGLVPIFLTITADGFFRRMMKGDYSDWTSTLRKSYINYIPNNKRYGNYLDYLDNNNTLTPKDIYKILSHQLNIFNKCKTLRRIKDAGKHYSSIRVTEPHKDGVPHFHILMYVPREYIGELFREFSRIFPAPRNSKRMTYKNTKGKNKRDGKYICTIDGKKMYETFGFQTEVISPVSYILKYILKSFTNLVEGKELDYLQAWYTHNKIPRLITSHLLVSQEIYYKVSLLDNDWYYLTEIKLAGGMTVDKDRDYTRFEDGRGRVIVVDSGLYILSNRGKIVSTFGSKQTFVRKVRLRSLDFVKFGSLKPPNFNLMDIYEIWTPPRKYNYLINRSFPDGTFCAFNEDGDFFLQFEAPRLGSIYSPEGIELTAISSGLKSVTSLSDYALFVEYNSFDLKKSVPARYCLIHNELITRGMLALDIVGLNSSFAFVEDMIMKRAM